jgi:hypothetical protein
MTMNDNEHARPEKPSAFWTKVYVSVIVVNITAIVLLWAFSRYFS